MKKLLFVCTANTCRSPMAEAIAPIVCRDRGIDVSCDSAGIFAARGDSMSANASAALEKLYGIKGFVHRSQPITKELFEGSDLVVGMTGSHVKLLESLFGKSDKIIAMPREIGDPYGGYLETYELAAREIAEGIERLIEKKVIV